jgi:hypothetical protein
LYIDLAAVWQSAKDFLNSNVFTAIAGSCAGAFFGAQAAQRIVARGKERDELLTEIRNTNAATVVSFAICNTFLALKQQYIKPLKVNFDAQNVAFRQYAAQQNLGQIPSCTSFHFTADFQMLFLSPIFYRYFTAGPLNPNTSLARTCRCWPMARAISAS